MRKMRKMMAVLLLLFVFALSAPKSWAGDIGCPGVTGDIQTPGLTGPQESPGLTGPQESPGITGDILFPGVLAALFGISWSG